ncbi:MAG: ABC transporter ATP-binding protein [Candidatus Bathyarchaeota archaeon]|nr:ABC transporter ATP-binding protein [Candidatus Bathyarchaeota archaeon]MDH5712599.1 ABC transporter ATP-binding protein [Candidatus Bathyarchaeota archaeon]
MTETTLNIEGLKTYFFTEAGIVKAVDGISFNLKKGESLGLVGESGSGKTVTALSVLRIVPKPGRIIDGKVEFNGDDLFKKTEKEMRRIRGSEIAIIFQDPSSSLNPVYNVETQLRDVIIAHQNIPKKEARKKLIELLETVELPDAETRMREYPHQFSGGMKQRVAIARALALEPTLLFADEPTTNLDVTIQAQVLDLLNDLKKRFGMSLVMITHDMGIIAKMTTRVVVLYAGRVCEIAKTYDLFERPRHPYTEALLAAVPRLDRRKTLRVIPGNIPNLIEPPTGCRFHPRCNYATQTCKEDIPVLEEIEPEHFVACHEWRNISLKGERSH